jgi:hypothetical protein
LAANRRSLAITKAYGRRLRAIERRILATNRRAWNLTGDFDADWEQWLAVMAPAVATAQTLGTRVTAAYLGAFRSSETGRVVSPPRLDTSGLIGRTRDGRTFEEGWTSPLIKTKVAMGEGKSIPQASKIGFEASSNLIRLDTYAAAREAMSRQIRDNDGIIGYKRVEGDEPTCGGCLAAIDNDVLMASEDFATHAGCDCVAEPVYGDVDDLFNHPSGAESYSRLSAEEKIEAVGLDAAQLIDDGQIQLAELKGVSVTALGDNFLTQRPLEDVT